MANIIDKIVWWFTKNAYGSPIEYTNPVKCVNPTSNLDYLYGPYKLPDGVTEPTLNLLPDELKNTLYPGKTFGIEKDGKIIEYWAQLKDSVIDASGFDFAEAVNNPENYDLIIKQCVDLDDVEVTRIPASFIDDLFDEDDENPTIDSDYLLGQTGSTEGEGTTGGTEEQGPTGGTEGEGTDFDPLPPPDPGMDPEAMGGTEE